MRVLVNEVLSNQPDFPNRSRGPSHWRSVGVFSQRARERLGHSGRLFVSVAALSWAFKQDVPRSAHKFVLVALANYADEGNCCYPSVERLCQDTSQDRKTVLSGLHFLRLKKLLTDTGQRVGRTGSIIVYRLNAKSPEAVPESELVPKTEQLRKRTQAVPKTDGSSPVFPPKQSQKRDTEPKGNHQGTIREPPTPHRTEQISNHPDFETIVKHFQSEARPIEERFSRELLWLAWLDFESVKDQDGNWYGWNGKRMIGDWRAAVEDKVSHLSTRKTSLKQKSAPEANQKHEDLHLPRL